MIKNALSNFMKFRKFSKIFGILNDFHFLASKSKTLDLKVPGSNLANNIFILKICFQGYLNFLKFSKFSKIFNFISKILFGLAPEGFDPKVPGSNLTSNIFRILWNFQKLRNFSRIFNFSAKILFGQVWKYLHRSEVRIWRVTYFLFIKFVKFFEIFIIFIFFDLHNDVLF